MAHVLHHVQQPHVQQPQSLPGLSGARAAALVVQSPREQQRSMVAAALPEGLEQVQQRLLEE